MYINYLSKRTADAIEEEEGGGNNTALMMQDDSASMLESVNEKTSAVVVINAEGRLKRTTGMTHTHRGF
jgi:hypothetical protein